VAIRWKQPPKKPFHHVSRDKILHNSWSILASARGFSDRHFERGKGPGDEVGHAKRKNENELLRDSVDVPAYNKPSQENPWFIKDAGPYKLELYSCGHLDSSPRISIVLQYQ